MFSLDSGLMHIVSKVLLPSPWFYTILGLHLTYKITPIIWHFALVDKKVHVQLKR